MKTFLSIIFLILFSFTTFAQEDTKVKVSVFASASEQVFEAEQTIVGKVKSFSYNPNITGQVLYRAGKASNFNFYVGGLYRRDFETDLNTIHGVGRVSYQFGKKVNFQPYAQFSAGTDFINFDSKVFSRELQFGGEFNFGPIGITPIAIAYKRVGSFAVTPEKSYLSGVSVNF